MMALDPTVCSLENRGEMLLAKMTDDLVATRSQRRTVSMLSSRVARVQKHNNLPTMAEYPRRHIAEAHWTCCAS